jgi:hypothetical protein
MSEIKQEMDIPWGKFFGTNIRYKVENIKGASYEILLHRLTMTRLRVDYVAQATLCQGY